MKNLILVLTLLLPAQAFSQVTGSGTANTIAKWTGTTSLGNSSVTDNGSLISTGEQFQLTGSTYPNLQYLQSAFTQLTAESSSGTWGWTPSTYPPLWEVIFSDTSARDSKPPLFLENTGDIPASAVNDYSLEPTALRVYSLVRGSTASTTQTNVSGIDVFQDVAAGYDGATGGTAITVNQFNSGPGSMWGYVARLWDNGFASHMFGMEIDTVPTSAPPHDLYGLAVVDSGGNGNQAVDTDAGFREVGYGHGIEFDNHVGPSQSISLQEYFMFVTNGFTHSTAAENNKTTVLGFNSGQPGSFNYGLDFRNAKPSGLNSFNNSGGCCAIIETSDQLNQLGKIGNTVLNGVATNNVAGSCSITGSVKSCSVTFTNSYTVAPICVVTLNSGSSPGSVSFAVNPTTTGLTIYSSATLNNNVFYVCIANPN